MVDRGNKDGHRYSYPGLKGRIVEESKWGRDKAAQRYGELQSGGMKPADTSRPQFREDQRATGWAGDTPKDWRIGYGKGSMESAETKPGYMRTRTTK